VAKSNGSEFGTAVSGLIAVVVVIAIVYGLTAAQFAGSGEADASPEAVAERIKPVGKVALAGSEPAPAPAAAAPATGEAAPGQAVYAKACFACHDTGAAGAPKLGDQAAWEGRAAQGIDQLLSIAINGKGAMPPRGTCADCSDDDLKVAIEFMLSKLQ
jgi:cytochrome c5